MQRILIADSNSILRNKIKQIIVDHFGLIIIHEASTGNEVLDVIGRHAFDCVLIDLELSEGDGWRVFKKIVAKEPALPVLVMTMFPAHQYEESLLKEGAQGYIPKVNLPNNLVEMLRQIVHGENETD